MKNRPIFRLVAREWLPNIEGAEEVRAGNLRPGDVYVEPVGGSRYRVVDVQPRTPQYWLDHNLTVRLQCSDPPNAVIHHGTRRRAWTFRLLD